MYYCTRRLGFLTTIFALVSCSEPAATRDVGADVGPPISWQECLEYETESECIAAGCDVWDTATRWTLDGEIMTSTNNAACMEEREVGICLRYSEPGGPSEIVSTYYRETEEGTYVVIRLGDDYPLAGWTNCEPNPEECPCP